MENSSASESAPVSASSIAINIFVAPREALLALQAKPRFLLALFVLLLVTSITTFIYWSGVDIGWMIEQAVTQNPNANPADVAEIVELIDGIPPAVVGFAATAFAVVFLTIVLLIQALYFKIVSLIARDEVTFKLWFAIVSFCALPTALRQLSTIANLLVNDISMMPQEKINPLSIGSLLGLEPAGRTFDSIVLNFDLMTIWSLALLVFASRIIANKSLGAAIAIVCWPVVLMTGLWLLG